MALKLDERYPGRANPPSVDYPQGSFKNRTSPDAKDGTFLDQDWANDSQGFFQSILSYFGVSASGQPDKVGASQYFDAITSDPTELKKGMPRFGTQSEVTAGSLDTVAITPKKFRAALGGLKGISVFEGTGTFTVPSGVTTVWVSGCGGGGGGGAGAGFVADRQLPGAGGGAGACVIRRRFTVTPGQSIAITIGARGSGGLGQSAGSAGFSGGTGGTTYFGSLLSLAGGAGGGGGSTSGIALGGVGEPRGSSVGGATSFSTLIQSGAGASSAFGGGGGSVPSASFQYIGLDAFGYGAGGGGGGGLTVNLSGPNGGFGSAGVLIIEW